MKETCPISRKDNYMMLGLPNHLKTHPQDELVNYILRQVEYVDEIAVVDLQDDIGTIDVLSKVLQVGIIGLSAYIVNTNKATRRLDSRQQDVK